MNSAGVPLSRGWRAWWSPARAAGGEAGVGPLRLHVAGEVLVPHEGIEPFLTERELREPDPRQLLLELHLRRLPGDFPRTTAWRPARYTGPPPGLWLERAQVLFERTLVAALELEPPGRRPW